MLDLLQSRACVGLRRTGRTNIADTRVPVALSPSPRSYTGTIAMNSWLPLAFSRR